MSAEELKQQGNAAFAAEDYDEAIDKFSQAIALDATNHILYSNRSAAYLAAGKKQEALDDAKKCVELNPNWSKGYLRLGKAQEAMGNPMEASEAYEKGLEIEPGNPLLTQASQAMQQDVMSQILGQLFGPDMYTKLEANPETAEYIKDPQIRGILDKIKTNPRLMTSFINNEKIGKCIQVLSGITDEMAERIQREREEMETSNAGGRQQQQRQGPSAWNRGSTGGENEKMQEKVEEVISENEREVIGLKDEGSRLYKERKFEEAIKKYKEAKNKVLVFTKVKNSEDNANDNGEAISAAESAAQISTSAIKQSDFDTLDPTYKHLPALCLNISAVYLTRKNFEKSIKWAKKAVSFATGTSAGGFEFLSKCYVRIAKCEMQLENYSAAVSSLKDAQMESDSREIRNLMRECKAKLREKRERDLYNPEKALELKTEANKKFAEKDYPKAIELYTQALTHDKENVDILNNRAFAYQSLGEFQQCIADAEEVVKIATSKGAALTSQPGKELSQLQKSIVKAYIRMARTYTMIQKFHYGAHYYNLASKLDPTNQDVAKGMNDIYVLFGKKRDSIIASREANMSDTLVKDLMSDPQVSHALTMLQGNPNNLNSMLSDKNLGPKLTELMLAGII